VKHLMVKGVDVMKHRDFSSDSIRALRSSLGKDISVGFPPRKMRSAASCRIFFREVETNLPQKTR
jgi:hypothetical protein